MHTHWGPSGWFTDPALAGGGALADMGIHAIDTARFLLGDPQPVAYTPHRQALSDLEVDDTGVILVNWDSGAVSYIESGWWQPHADGIEAATQLYGKDGFASLYPTRIERLDRAEKTVLVEDPGFAFPPGDHAPQDMYNRQMACFLDCIQTGTVPVPGALEGWINMRITDAAYQSSRTGQVVVLEQVYNR